MQPELRATRIGSRWGRRRSGRRALVMLVAMVGLLAALGPAGPARADVHTVVAGGEATAYMQEPGQFWFTGIEQHFVVDGDPFVIDGLYGLVQLNGADDPSATTGSVSWVTMESLGPKTGDYHVSLDTRTGTWNRVWSPGLLISWEASITTDTTLCHTPPAGARTCITVPVNYRFSGNGWQAEHTMAWTGTSPPV